MFYYKQVVNGKILSVEAKTRKSQSPGFEKATLLEYQAFIASLPVVKPPPERNLAQELDDFKARLKTAGIP